MYCEFIATATFGLESVVKRELEHLGYDRHEVENGKVTFKADEKAIPHCNLWLRSADRLLLKMGQFRAVSFEDLFEKTKALPWDQWITKDGKFTVNGKSIKSRLYSVPDCQAIVKKAVVEKLKEKYHTDWFQETGPEYNIEVALLKDEATLTIDTSGPGLHKRGYRLEAVEAPLKETLAAALVSLSFWNKGRVLHDPFCGSGTIAIEAALIGKNIAPGLNRSFASEGWPQLRKLWKPAKVEAFKAIDHDAELDILASDIDARAIELAQENAIEAGVADCITFSCAPVSQVKIKDKYGVMITNPPYGERIGNKSELADVYLTLKNLFKNQETWSLYVITADERFEQIYGKADRRRKLFNGRIKVDYYQYYGERPPKKTV
ncbi:class I SAM-dependent RNA methyltransferase [Metallumcola ferriviriculae]|uniref:Class I SAM-dependent RNA methyltransferase n=1 Tax=Metallumcola ferriviriculae TaxID=3039180 RepID=A0AAU0UJP0_9FIRM|nr:class I SAM-dependent RNA methyltransferase [Desulfitibacteraceae bacterium MK1]